MILGAMRFRIAVPAFAAVILFFCFCAPLRAQKYTNMAFPRELEADLSAGTTAIYMLDFKTAEDHFNRAIEIMPEHPAAYFFLTMLYWYELAYDTLINRNPVIEKAIEDQAELTISVAKKFTKNEDTKTVGNLYWGGALGAKGWFYFSRGQWVRSYFSGKKGYVLAKKVIERDPELYDAYLGVGMYEYYAATLGPVLRALSSFFVRGDREKALKYLHTAEQKSRYVKLEAAYFLWNAAVEEGWYGEAYDKIEVLTRTFPKSPLFRWSEIQTLFFQMKWEEVLKKSDEYISYALAGPQPENFIHPYSLLLAKVYYHMGAAAFNLKKYELALSCFEKAIACPSDFDGWRIMAYLRAGELCDIQGKREKALAYYKAVLKYPKVWNSTKVARDRINKPFRRDPNPKNGFIYSPLELWRQELK